MLMDQSNINSHIKNTKPKKCSPTMKDKFKTKNCILDFCSHHQTNSPKPKSILKMNTILACSKQSIQIHDINSIRTQSPIAKNVANILLTTTQTHKNHTSSQKVQSVCHKWLFHGNSNNKPRITFFVINGFFMVTVTTNPG